jgi:hypothetical protein
MITAGDSPSSKSRCPERAQQHVRDMMVQAVEHRFGAETRRLELRLFQHDMIEIYERRL